jgi:hypothetical protein
MDRFFDEAARVLAKPMPRRQMFKYIGAALAAAFFMKPKPVSALACGTACQKESDCTGSVGIHCTSNGHCCPNNSDVGCGASHCCSGGAACCNTNTGNCFTSGSCAQTC